VQILKILGLLEKLESTISRLYSTFARSFRDDNSAAQFFDQMSMEESLHANLVKFQRRIVTSNIKDCKEIDFDAQEVEKTIEEVMRVIETNERLSLEAALKISLDLENSMAERHYQTAVQRSLPDIVKLMNSLTSFDCRHFDAFLSYAQKKGFNFEMEKNSYISVCTTASIENIKITQRYSEEESAKKGLGTSKEFVERIEYLYEWQDKMDYYKVLGVRVTASSNEIKRTYHKLAKELHPDMHINLPQNIFKKLNSVFSRITLAYSILMNEGSRLKYNKSLPSRLK